MNVIFSLSRIRTWLAPAVPPGVLSPPSNRRRNQRALSSTSQSSMITVRRLKMSWRRSARMCWTFLTNPSSPRPRLASLRSSTTRCRHTRLFRLSPLLCYHFANIMPTGRVITTAISLSLPLATSARLLLLLPMRLTRYVHN